MIDQLLARAAMTLGVVLGGLAGYEAVQRLALAAHAWAGHINAAAGMVQ